MAATRMNSPYAADQSRFGRMIVIANNEHRFLVAEQLAAIGISNATLVLEPIARNTAPAAAIAAIQRRKPMLTLFFS